jgi:hypothetical protein
MLLEKRALWLRKEQARKKRAAEVHHCPPDFTTAIQYSLFTRVQIAARPISDNARLIGCCPPTSHPPIRALNASVTGQLWMSMIQRTAAREFVKSIRGDTPVVSSGGKSGLDAAQTTSHRSPLSELHLFREISSRIPPQSP